MKEKCLHKNPHCLNPYEYVRKYLCLDCDQVMMCECDRSIGEAFLSHQLGEGCELSTQKRYPVTLGFQKDVCDECRGNPVSACPRAEIYGHTSKVRRYYWREIFFESCKRYSLETGDSGIPHKFPERLEQIEDEVVEHFKSLHQTNPKYKYTEVSDAEIIKNYDIDVIKVRGEHVRIDERKVRIRSDGRLLTVEEFAIKYFSDLGGNVTICESRPFHALFGNLMWLLIQDYHDPQNRMIGFGKRSQETGQNEIVWTTLPDDFGTSGYYDRRLESIKEHLDSLEDVHWLFDYWLEPSTDFREYLWAQGDSDVATAKGLLDMFSRDEIKLILRTLVKNYWKNYCGWPDLLVIMESEKFFVEVKSANDRLSEDQKNWIALNSTEMHFGFKIFKVLKEGAPT